MTEPRKKTIRKIESTASLFPLAPTAQTRKRRVAAYARVSTDSDEQLSSYEAQPLSPSGEPPPEPSKRGT